LSILKNELKTTIGQLFALVILSRCLFCRDVFAFWCSELWAVPPKPLRLCTVQM